MILKVNLIIRYCISVFFLLVCTCSAAATDLPEIFDVLWEMQWHQSGYPMNASKWDFRKGRQVTLHVAESIQGRNVERVKDALDKVSKAAGIEFVQVGKDANAQLTMTVRRFTDDEKRSMPCFANVPSPNFYLARVKVEMDEGHVWRCAIHELMHAMGHMGHPLGDTVLTYFGGDRSDLYPLDKFMLNHWNSDLITAGMNVFRVSKLLNLKWIEENVPATEQAQAREVEKEWFAKTIAQMDALADDKGEPPRVLYRSGRLSASGLQRSKNVVQGMLGTAYLHGFGVEPNPARAYTLLFRGAMAMQVGAIAALERGFVDDKFMGVDAKPACAWFRERLVTVGRKDLITLNAPKYAKTCGDAFLP